MSSEAKPEDQQSACPVDHKSREAWLSQARAASASASESSTLPPDHPPIPRGTNTDTAAGAGGGTATAESCPVDHKAREVWLQQARAVGSAASASTTTTAPSNNRTPSTPSSSWSSWTAYLPSLWASPTSRSGANKRPTPPPHDDPASLLGTEREVSSIPRTATSSYPASYSAAASQPPAPASVAPATQASHGATAAANNEQETGADAATGNWIYPSERMFFEAMRRKGYVDNDGDDHGGGARRAAREAAADMRAVVPIHNAGNERAWAEIKAWEAPWIARLNAERERRRQQQQEDGTGITPGDGICDGPRLHSFAGLSDRPTPRARFNALLGYQAPFDRHDWVVDRCGTRVEYVIDFYAGRRGGAGAGAGASSSSSPDPGPAKPLSFYLDVRPKLNSWEGVKMRAYRALGLV